MAAASSIGLGKAHGQTLREVFHTGIDSLRNKMIGFGGHTDEHAYGLACGCGAVDKAPIAIANAVKYEEQIRTTLQVLGIDESGLDDVFGNYEAYAEAIKDDTSYSGADVMNEIVSSGKVVKELRGNHLEMYIVLNMTKGYTVNQEAVRQATGDEVQVFGVDVWRMKDVADRLYANESEDVRHQAFLSELVYTLGVAATLTKGDLPVYVANRNASVAA